MFRTRNIIYILIALIVLVVISMLHAQKNYNDEVAKLQLKINAHKANVEQARKQDSINQARLIYVTKMRDSLQAAIKAKK